MEQVSNHTERHENDVVSSKSFHQIEAKISVLENHLSTLADAGVESADISEQRGKRIKNAIAKLKAIARVGVFATATLIGYETIGHQTSRYTISEEADAKGNKRFTHEDERTNRIMQYLTGESQLSPEDQIIFLQQLVREELVRTARIEGRTEREVNDIEQELGSSLVELKAQLIQTYKAQDTYIGTQTLDYIARADEAFEEALQTPMEYSPEFATVLWQLQKKVGAPRIRWASPLENGKTHSFGNIIGHGRAWYHPAENTVYLRPGETGQTLVAEDAHAHQFNQHPIQSRIRGVLDLTRTAVHAIRDNESLVQKQYEQYRTEGTLEYEAHSIIEPELVRDAIQMEQENKTE